MKKECIRSVVIRVTNKIERHLSVRSIYLITSWILVELDDTRSILTGYHTFIIWLQKYARFDWLLSGYYFIVMTGHYENFSRLDGSFEL